MPTDDAKGNGTSDNTDTDDVGLPRRDGRAEDGDQPDQAGGGDGGEHPGRAQSLTRREMLRATAAAGTVAMTAGEAAAATDAARSPLVQAGDNAGLGWSPPDVDLYRRHGSPSWIVRYSDVERSASIDEWVGGDESNQIGRASCRERV